MEVEAPCGGGSAGESRWSLGSSLAVRNVQDLVSSSAAEELTPDMIQRYIQPDIDAHAVLPDHSDEVPVIDLGKLLNAETVEAETAKLKLACEEWGFFQVRSLNSCYISSKFVHRRLFFQEKYCTTLLFLPVSF
jgi:hypothetical protein